MQVAECAQLTPGFHEYLLRRIASVCLVAENRHGGSKSGLETIGHEPAEGFAIPLTRPRHKLELERGWTSGLI
jgi:hypothetical protein